MEMSPEYDGTQAALDDFQVSLEVFEGPFDLLLQLISRKKLDITQVALAEVTDEFIAHMRAFLIFHGPVNSLWLPRRYWI